MDEIVRPLRFARIIAHMRGIPICLGTGPNEGTLWGSWEGHLWEALDPPVHMPWWLSASYWLDMATLLIYLDSRVGYVRLVEVSYDAQTH